MSAIPTQHLSQPSLRERFHRRSLDHQRPLSLVTMGFTVVAFLCMVVVRELIRAPASPLGYRLLCALVLALLVLAIPRAKSTTLFGAIGVAYELVLIGGLVLNASGLTHPLAWLLPAFVVIPICAAPLWLTPAHFATGSALFYAAAIPLLRGKAHAPEVDAAVWTWVIAIGAPMAVVFHFGFYRFRRNHFLLESQLAQLAATDPLTGLQNRRSFVKHAEGRLETLAPGAQISAIFLDIDSFKSLNDRFGHAVGDLALFQVAQVLKDAVALYDSVSRIGGEEFALLIDEDLTGALQLAERLRLDIAAIERPDGHLTASFGVAEHRRGESFMVLLDRADEALLRAKQTGRNRVCAERALPFDALQPPFDDVLAPRYRWEDFYLISHFQPLYSLSHQKQVGFEA